MTKNTTIQFNKGTTIGRGTRKSKTLNKHKKRSYKPYKGQGK